MICPNFMWPISSEKTQLWPLECLWICRSSPGLADHLYWFTALGGKLLNAKVGDRGWRGVFVWVSFLIPASLQLQMPSSQRQQLNPTGGAINHDISSRFNCRACAGILFSTNMVSLDVNIKTSDLVFSPSLHELCCKVPTPEHFMTFQESKPLTYMILIFVSSAATWWQPARLCVWSNSDLLHSRIKVLARYSCPPNQKGLFDDCRRGSLEEIAIYRDLLWAYYWLVLKQFINLHLWHLCSKFFALQFFLMTIY